MSHQEIFTADVTLITGVKVKALVQAQNIAEALKSLECVYGVGHVGMPKANSSPVHPDIS